MNPLVSMLASQLGGPALAQISQQIGADSSTTQSAINTALPMLLSAMGNHANENGADALQQEAQNQDGVLDDVMGFLGNSQASGIGSALLNQFVGGNNNNAIANLIGQQSGLSAGSATQLLALLTPIVMGALNKANEGNDVNGLAEILGSAVGSTNGNDLLGMATKMLDADGDGNVMEEIGGLLNKFI